MPFRSKESALDTPRWVYLSIGTTSHLLLPWDIQVPGILLGKRQGEGNADKGKA